MNNGHDIYRYIGYNNLYHFDSNYLVYYPDACGVYLDGIFQDATTFYYVCWETGVVNIIYIAGIWALYIQGINIKWNCDCDYNYNLVLLNCYCGILCGYCVNKSRTFDIELCSVNTIGFDVL